MTATKVDIDGAVTSLDGKKTPGVVITAEDVKDLEKLARLLQETINHVGELERRANPDHVDFEDVTMGTSGATTQLEHRFGGRARWQVIGWRSTGPGDLFNAGTLWVKRAFCGPGTLATAAGDYTNGCRFQATSAMRVWGVRFAWFASGTTRTITAKLWRDSDGLLLGSGTVSVTNSGMYIATFTTPVDLSGANLSVNLTVSIYDGGHDYTSTGADAAFTGLFPLTLPGYTLSAINLYSAGDARPTSTAVSERYWVEPYVAPPAPGISENTTASDGNTLALSSYVPGVATIRVEDAG